ncbi:olfactory receptor-like protein OLF1 [Bombina bombina]|uniref:olfactory receptor-like protein OLF1 n=1 Tax=Bombina bombina TaxID=8345 RepID=UPI00235A7B2C|nr:olfactory receptor-like protein OLF1 [Bombina bombina]
MYTNYSSVSEYIILGLSTRPELEKFIFITFLIIYIVAIIGNLMILILTNIDPGLNTPMYFFLGFLSFLDICSTSATLPKMLTDYVSKTKTISFYGCAAQLFFFTWLTSTELLLLAVMAYDRYVAIVNPLRYVAIINRKVCICVTTAISITGSVNSTTHTSFTFRLPYCDDNKINHFFCDIMPLLKLSCADTYLNEVVLFIADVILGMFCFLLICISYVFIINTITKIRSTKGKQKAFSTCASHITIVSMYYGAVIFTYIRPRSSLSLEKDKIVSALYAVFIPTLNPIIYSLRNKEVKDAFKRMVRVIVPKISTIKINKVQLTL